MTSSGALPTLGGETREITLFFSDVVGFPLFPKAMKPEEIVSLMNGYLTSMGEAIEGAGGFVDKYVGDAIVAIFGAPVRSADHASRPLRRRSTVSADSRPSIATTLRLFNTASA